MFNDKIINEIKDCMISNEQTLTVAESVTAGFLQASFGSAQNASMYFEGGISAYNVGQKVKHLMVEPIHAINYNCVSEKIALEMALYVCKKSGISVTGYAAPVPESDNKLFAYYAIVFQNSIVEKGRLDAETNSPLAIQLFYVDEILKRLHNSLTE